jgi:hypothetical protein
MYVRILYMLCKQGQICIRECCAWVCVCVCIYIYIYIYIHTYIHTYMLCKYVCISCIYAYAYNKDEYVYVKKSSLRKFAWVSPKLKKVYKYIHIYTQTCTLAGKLLSSCLKQMLVKCDGRAYKEVYKSTHILHEQTSTHTLHPHTSTHTHI